MFSKENKAFTLIELMAVVIILGIISTITVVTINFSIKNAKNKLFAEQVVRLQNSVKEWSVNNTSLLPTDGTGISFFSINRLLEEGIISSEEVIDPRYNKTLEGCLTIKYDETYNQYTYEYLDEMCDTVVDAYKPTITVIGGLNQYAEVNEVYTLPTVIASDYKGNNVIVEGPIIKRENAIVTKLDPVIVGNVFTLTYTATDINLGLTTTKVVNVTVNDTKKPSICVLYNGETKCSSFSFIYQSTDSFIAPPSTVTDNSCGITGSEPTVNNCATTLNALVSGSVNPMVPGNYDVTYVATDSSGNVSNPLIITVTVEDRFPPSIATYDMKLNTSTGSIYNSGWTNQNVWVGNILSTDVGAGVEKYQYSLDCLNSWTDIVGSRTFSSEVNTTSYCIRAIDYSGNISGTVNKTMKIDKTAPTAGTLTMKLGTSTGSNYTDNTWSNQNIWIDESIGSDTLSGHASTTYAVTGANPISSTTTANTLTNDGTSTVTITTTDNAGNTSTRTYTIKIDKVVPTIAFGTNGNSTYAKTHSTTVTSSDATSGVNASSLEYQWTTSTTAPTEASFSLTFTSGSTISTQAGVNGGYYLWILAKDTTGNTTITRSNVFNLDNTGPVITMNGTSPITLEAGSTYTDAGATSNDAISGSRTVTTSGSVNPSIPGTYTITYTSSDALGNTSTLTRTVNVVDTTGPTVAFGTNGNSTYAKTYSTTVTVSDNVAVNSSSLEYQWTTSTTAPTEASFSLTFTSGSTVSTQAGLNGGYYLWILAKDNTGNTTITRSNVFNLDNTGPVITMNGTTPITLEAGSTYTDAGATATDAISGVRTVSTSGSVNPSVPGTYTITYTSSDALGNTSTLNRTVNVVDTTGPTVAFGTNGNSTYAKSRTTTVTVSDNVAVNASSLEYQWTTSTTAPAEASFSLPFTSGATISTPVSVTGGYYLWILAKDNTGNTTITRSNVFNLDNTNPILAMSGDNTTWKNINSTVTITSSDANSGLSTTQYSTDNVNWTTYSAALSYTSDTNITLYARATDAAGNTATISGTVKIDKTVPTISIAGGNSAWKNTNSSITLTSGDTGGSSLSTTQYSTDNVNWTTYSSALSYTTDTNITIYAKATDGAGNVSTTSTTVKIDKTVPVIASSLVGGMRFLDPTFALGSNSMGVYNNSGGGTVVHTREAMTTPVGNYAMKIVTSGTASPGVGGFVQSVVVSANRKYYHRIIAKIPVGYSMAYAANAVGDSPIWSWLTSTAGTGDWEEYIYTLSVSGTGTFNNFGYVYLSGPAGTPTVPVTWHVAYASIFDVEQWGATNSVAFKGTDALSGVAGYGVNQSSTVAPTFTAVTPTSSLGTHYTNITANGTYYLWIEDDAGNTTNTSFVVSRVDGVDPVITLSGANPYEITVGTAFTEPGVSATDNSGFTPTITTSTIPTASGSYTITYTATDIAGNTATATREFYIWSAWSGWTTTVATPSATQQVETKLQQRSTTRSTLWSSSSALTGAAALPGQAGTTSTAYTKTGSRSTTYGAWGCSVTQWDLCAQADYNKTVTYGGYLNQQTSYYQSPGRNGWWCQGYNTGCGLVATYSHSRCGLSVTYKYTSCTSGACNSAYTEEKCTRTFTDTWQYYQWSAWTAWTDVASCAANTADINYGCQTLYRYRTR